MAVLGMVNESVGIAGTGVSCGSCGDRRLIGVTLRVLELASCAAVRMLLCEEAICL